MSNNTREQCRGTIGLTIGHLLFDANCKLIYLLLCAQVDTFGEIVYLDRWRLNYSLQQNMYNIVDPDYTAATAFVM